MTIGLALQAKWGDFEIKVTNPCFPILHLQSRQANVIYNGKVILSPAVYSWIPAFPRCCEVQYQSWGGSDVLLVQSI